MSDSPHLALPYLAPSQSQKHVTVNEALRILDAVVQLSVLSATTTAQPASPADGDRYILPTGKTGAAWSAMAIGSVAAYQDGARTEYAPHLGWRAYIVTPASLVVWNGSAWTPVSAGGGSETATKFGVNTAADTTNRLAVKSDAVLFSHDDVTPGSGDSQVKVNKASAADTASHLFQTNFSGRAEFGLTGDDDFHLKVSATGASFIDAIVIDSETADVGVGGLFGSVSVFPALTAAPAFTVRNGDTGRPTLGLIAAANGAPGCRFDLFRAQGTLSAPTAPALDQTVGVFNFFGYDGARYLQTASFRVSVDGTPVANTSCPMRLVFMTGETSVIERMRITSAGLVGIATTAPVCALDVAGPVRVGSYAKASLPAAAAGAGQMIYVSDEVGGAVIAFSDGTNWRRVTDRAVVA
jgi:hypothetical protein